jgi:hypothetical protein
MKNILPIAALLGGGLFLVNYFKRKRAAGENLKFELAKITIDTPRTLQTGLLKIFYDITLNVINSENAAVNVKNLNIDVTVNGKNFGNLSQTLNFSIPQQSEKKIMLKASFFTLGALQLVKDIVLEGINFNINLNGFIDTDLGRVNIDFNKQFGGGVNGYYKKKNSF